MEYASLQREQGVKKRTNSHQRKNRTGIPDNMKCRYEELSGVSFDDVRVHYYSDKPSQLQALAYTQGNQVYISPGQGTKPSGTRKPVVQRMLDIKKYEGFEECIRSFYLKKALMHMDYASLYSNAASQYMDNTSQYMTNASQYMDNTSQYMTQGSVDTNRALVDMVNTSAGMVNTSEYLIHVSKRLLGHVKKNTKRASANIDNAEKYIGRINELVRDYQNSGPQGNKNNRYKILVLLRNILNKQIHYCVGGPGFNQLRQLHNDVMSEIKSFIDDQENICKAEGFEAKKIVFVTINEKEKIGSIYFANGKRIRLIHGHGPKVSMDKASQRYCIHDGQSIDVAFWTFQRKKNRPENVMSNFLVSVGYKCVNNIKDAQLITYQKNSRWAYGWNVQGFSFPQEAKYWKAPTNKILNVGDIQKAFEEFAKQEKDQETLNDFMIAFGAQNAEAGSGGRLFEIIGFHSHLSRGGPKEIGLTLTDKDINVLYMVAQLGDNCELFKYMQNSNNLKQIPMNNFVEKTGHFQEELRTGSGNGISTRTGRNMEKKW